MEIPDKESSGNLKISEGEHYRFYLTQNQFKVLRIVRTIP